MLKHKFLLFVGVLVIVLFGTWTADRFLKHRDHPGIITFLRQWATNYPKSFTVDPPLVRITIDAKDLAHLQAVVDQALERGVIMPEGDHYVDAEIAADGGHFRAKLRIKGKMTDHVSGRKWSFRVIAKKGGGFKGMRRFSLQHPGTRNYLREWFYHRLMRGEGMVTLRYGFCKVQLNGEDLGVYAYEEHFGQELLENNGRLPGPLLRFDPALFWEHRLNGIEGVHVDDAYGAYQAAALDAYGTSDLAADPADKAVYEQALALVDAFRRGRKAASEVFDVDRTARRLALLDLIGGHHSMDWSDVKFYFDPVAQRLEPVSYESFSAFPIRELAGAYQFEGKFREEDDLHRQLFNDPDIMAAYVHHLERYMRKEFLDSTFKAIADELDTAGAMLFGEFPYEPLDRSIYYANQRAIRALLSAPAPLHVHLQGIRNDTVSLLAIPTDALPVRIESIVLPHGRTGHLVGEPVVPCRSRGRLGAPFPLVSVFSGPVSMGDLQDAKLLCHFLGSGRSIAVPVSPFRSDSVLARTAPAQRAGDMEAFPFLEVDEAAHEVRVIPGAWRIEKDLIVPEGYRFRARPPLRLTLAQGAAIISRSPLEWVGTEAMPILVSADSLGSMGMHVIDAGRISVLEHVHFEGLRGTDGNQPLAGNVSFHRSPLHAVEVSFAGGGGTLLAVTLSNSALQDCSFIGGRDQLECAFSAVTIVGSWFSGAGDDAISITGGSAALNGTRVDHCSGSAIKASVHGRVQVDDCIIDAAGTGLNASEAGSIIMNGGTVQADRVAHSGKDRMRYGPSRVLMNAVQAEFKGRVERGAGSVLKVNGKEMGGSPVLKGT
ncbi:MAG: CotH kinase family protein [Flavobacteriales bacterium]|nr:CotH kinase family protein [Flavobacteriales bacterium]MCB9193606.1 CotH kinase family protein [Flavobacteriales bacterium]